MSKKQITIFFATMLIITGFAIWKASSLEKYGGVVQAWVTVVLVLVTAAYAYNVKRQTDANVEMAKEMRKQRKSSTLPIIDLKYIPDSIQTFNCTSEGNPLESLFNSSIRNIGIGPAIDVYLAVDKNINGNENTGKYEYVSFFQTMAKDDEIKFHLDKRFLSSNYLAYIIYRDIYGDFYFSKQHISKDMNNIEYGDLNKDEYIIIMKNCKESVL